MTVARSLDWSPRRPAEEGVRGPTSDRDVPRPTSIPAYAQSTAIDRGSLPTPTRDADQLKRDLVEHGYGLLRDALSADQVKAVRDRMLEQAEIEGERGVAMVGDGRGEERVFAAHADATTRHQLVRSLLNKGEVFRDLAVHADVLSLMHHMLGDHFLLSSTNGIIMRAGSRRQVCHTDQLYIGFSAPIPVVANVLYMITEFDEERGGTRLVPGSHQWEPPCVVPIFDSQGKVLRVEDEEVESVAAEGPAGTAIVFEGRLWHFGGENVSGELRLAISTYYCRSWVRQQDLLPLSINEDVYADMSDELKRLVGFSLMSPGQLGRIDPALGRTNLETQLPFIPELHR
jgi:ectoine hydroxylase-related dioxygenase (phytanoyl-CoA dioxygenase family)